VAAPVVSAGGADLDLHAQQGDIGVDDQRADVVADVQHHMLRMRSGCVALLAASPRRGLRLHGVSYSVADGDS
jgi:hypothetical protein